MSVVEVSPSFPPQDPSEVISNRDVERAHNHVAALTQNIGSLTLLKSKPIRDRHGFHRVRHDGVMTAQGLDYTVRITDPAVELGVDAPTLMGHFPGFTEDPTCGIAADLHADTAAQYPARRVASIGSDGYDEHGTPMGWRDIGRSFRHMGVSRLMLLGELAGDDEVALFVVSKGSRLGREVVEQNDEMQLINHQFTAFISPAILPKGHVIRDMGLRFPPHMGYEVGREIVQHPFRSLHTAVSSGRRVNRFVHRLPAYTCDLINLLQPCTAEDVRVLAKDPRKLAIIQGATDPLGQQDFWRAVQQDAPDNVEIRVVPHVGHALSADTRATAQVMSEMERSLRTSNPTS
jgi:hypothetical protein